jgi:hypothetical protein
MGPGKILLDPRLGLGAVTTAGSVGHRCSPPVVNAARKISCVVARLWFVANKRTAAAACGAIHERKRLLGSLFGALPSATRESWVADLWWSAKECRERLDRPTHIPPVQKRGRSPGEQSIPLPLLSRPHQVWQTGHRRRVRMMLQRGRSHRRYSWSGKRQGARYLWAMRQPVLESCRGHGGRTRLAACKDRFAARRTAPGAIASPAGVWLISNACRGPFRPHGLGQPTHW